MFVADELFFLAGANMKSMAKFYSSIYDNFDMDRFAELTKTFGLDPSKSISNFSKGMKRQAAMKHLTDLILLCVILSRS